MRIAMIGTRGIPAAYGGFETAVEEVSKRLVGWGHEVTVYTRGSTQRSKSHFGIRVVHLPALPQKQLETLSHTGLSALHAVIGRAPDAAFVFNAANAPFLPLLRVRGIPTALHMDGLEWKRAKWGRRGRAYYRWAEEFGVRQAEALIADAPGIAEYYDHQFGLPTELIRYGAPIQERASDDKIRGFGLNPNEFHLVVARFEPENHVLEIVEGYHESGCLLPLIVVGSAPYSAEYTRAIEGVAAADDRIQLLGGIFDQSLLDELYFHARTYLHGHSVGGTNPSLLRAMGAGTAVIAHDVVFNREVLAGRGWFFSTAAEVAAALDSAEQDSAKCISDGKALRLRAVEDFSWDDVARSYESLATRLARGETLRQTKPRRRRTDDEWTG